MSQVHYIELRKGTGGLGGHCHKAGGGGGGGCKKMKKHGLVVREVMVVVVAVVVVAVVVQLLLLQTELLLSTKALPAGLPLTHISFVRPLHTTVKLQRMH